MFFTLRSQNRKDPKWEIGCLVSRLGIHVNDHDHKRLSTISILAWSSGYDATRTQYVLDDHRSSITDHRSQEVNGKGICLRHQYHRQTNYWSTECLLESAIRFIAADITFLEMPLGHPEYKESQLSPFVLQCRLPALATFQHASTSLTLKYYDVCQNPLCSLLHRSRSCRSTWNRWR
jgi:hypothetical protein